MLNKLLSLSLGFCTVMYDCWCVNLTVMFTNIIVYVCHLGLYRIRRYSYSSIRHAFNTVVNKFNDLSVNFYTTHITFTPFSLPKCLYNFAHALLNLAKKASKDLNPAPVTFLYPINRHMWPPWELPVVNEGNEIQQLLIIGSMLCVKLSTLAVVNKHCLFCF